VVNSSYEEIEQSPADEKKQPDNNDGAVTVLKAVYVAVSKARVILSVAKEQLSQTYSIFSDEM
jgi:hypothetical protein